MFIFVRYQAQWSSEDNPSCLLELSSLSGSWIHFSLEGTLDRGSHSLWLRAVRAFPSAPAILCCTQLPPSPWLGRVREAREDLCALQLSFLELSPPSGSLESGQCYLTLPSPPKLKMATSRNHTTELALQSHILGFLEFDRNRLLQAELANPESY